MTTYRLIIAYDGSLFGGWQVQPHTISIQQKVQEALYTITKESVSIIGSGRTDAGVHALGQVAHMHLSYFINPDKLKHSLNGILPKSIRIMEVFTAPDTFHAQRSAIGKTYQYTLYTKEVVSPFEAPYVWHYRYSLDRDLLQKAALYCVGTHDFAAFANARGKPYPSTIRDLYRLDVRNDDYHIWLTFEGSGFLYKMVRNITGTLIDIASGKRAFADLETIFTSKDRKQASAAAPPHGLMLMSVTYPQHAISVDCCEENS